MPFAAKDILQTLGADITSGKAAFISSGLVDECLGVVTAYKEAGEAGLADTDHNTLTMSLQALTICAGEPEVDAKLHGAAAALEYCLDHSLDCAHEIGASSGAYGAELCAALFGRMEAGSGFNFKQAHVDELCAQLACQRCSCSCSCRSDRAPCPQVGQVVADRTRRGVLGQSNPLGGHDLYPGALCVRRKTRLVSSALLKLASDTPELRMQADGHVKASAED